MMDSITSPGTNVIEGISHSSATTTFPLPLTTASHVNHSHTVHLPTASWSSSVSEISDFPSTSTRSAREPFVPALDPLGGKHHPNPDQHLIPDANTNTTADTSDSSPLTSKALESLASSLPAYLAVGAVVLGVLCVIGAGGWWYRRRRRRRRFINFVGDLESTISEKSGRLETGCALATGKKRGWRSTWWQWQWRRTTRRTAQPSESREHVKSAAQLDRDGRVRSGDDAIPGSLVRPLVVQGKEGDACECYFGHSDFSLSQRFCPPILTFVAVVLVSSTESRADELPVLMGYHAVLVTADPEDEKALCGSPAISISDEGGDIPKEKVSAAQNN
ncbi:hypothetical protein IAU59_000847 [Kwoniella sp. CBS 9459]